MNGKEDPPAYCCISASNISVKIIKDLTILIWKYLNIEISLSKFQIELQKNREKENRWQNSCIYATDTAVKIKKNQKPLSGRTSSPSILLALPEFALALPKIPKSMTENVSLQ